jgi:hypothetical protein
MSLRISFKVTDLSGDEMHGILGILADFCQKNSWREGIACGVLLGFPVKSNDLMGRGRYIRTAITQQVALGKFEVGKG